MRVSLFNHLTSLPFVSGGGKVTRPGDVTVTVERGADVGVSIGGDVIKAAGGVNGGDGFRGQTMNLRHITNRQR